MVNSYFSFRLGFFIVFCKIFANENCFGWSKVKQFKSSLQEIDLGFKIHRSKDLISSKRSKNLSDVLEKTNLKEALRDF